MNYHRKQKSPPVIHNPAYRQAFERLDIALSENSLSYNLEKKEAIFRSMFGRESVESANHSAEEAQTIREESSE